MEVYAIFSVFCEIIYSDQLEQIRHMLIWITEWLIWVIKKNLRFVE